MGAIGSCSKVESGRNLSSDEPEAAGSFDDGDAYDVSSASGSAAGEPTAIGDPLQATDFLHLGLFGDGSPDESEIGFHETAEADQAQIEALALENAEVAELDSKDRTGSVSFEQVGIPYRVFKDGLAENVDVSVQTGPVVGKVTQHSAVVLLEVAAPAEVSVNFARVAGWRCPQNAARLDDRDVEDMLFQAEGSVSVCHLMEPNRPHAFVVWGLEPGTKYVVFLSNVSKDDMERRVARFRTLPERVESLRLIAFCGHRPPAKPLGTSNPWQHLLGVARAGGPEVQVVLHTGTIIDSAPAVSEATRILTDYAYYKEGIRLDREQRAQEAIRSAYRDAWGQHDALRRVLSGVGSHLPVFAPATDMEIIFRQLTAMDKEDLAGDEIRALFRASLRGYHDYQRSLLGASDSSAFSQRGPSRSPTTELWQQVAGPGEGEVEEWHFHRYGRIGIFVVDTKGHHFRSDGRALVEDSESGNPRRLLSDRQWRTLNEAMRDEDMQVLLVVSDAPFMLEQFSPLAGTAAKHVHRSPSPQSGQRSPAATPQSPQSRPRSSKRFEEEEPEQTLSWRAHQAELHRFLKALFEWKQSQFPAREVVLITGGPGFATTGDIVDHRLGLSIPTVMTGPMLGRVSTAEKWTLNGSIAGGRFSYVYGQPTEEWNFCTIDLDLTSPKPSVEVQLTGVPIPTGTLLD